METIDKAYQQALNLEKTNLNENHQKLSKGRHFWTFVLNAVITFGCFGFIAELAHEKAAIFGSLIVGAYLLKEQFLRPKLINTKLPSVKTLLIIIFVFTGFSHGMASIEDIQSELVETKSDIDNLRSENDNSGSNSNEHYNDFYNHIQMVEVKAEDNESDLQDLEIKLNEYEYDLLMLKNKVEYMEYHR